MVGHLPIFLPFALKTIAYRTVTFEDLTLIYDFEDFKAHISIKDKIFIKKI